MHEDLAPPAQEAVEHLRAAALELIGAARAVLDLTEELIKDPEPLLALAASLTAAARAATTATTATTGTTATKPPTASTNDPADTRHGRVQHIKVS